MVDEERAYLGGGVTCDFQTRYGFCFFQLHGRYEKAEPVPGSFHASILSPRRLTSLANVGLSNAQLVPSCEYGKRNMYYKYKPFKSITRTELRIYKTTTYITNIRLSRAQLIHYNIISPYIPLLYKTFKSTTRTELSFRLSPVILPHRHYDETTGWRLPHDRV